MSRATTYPKIICAGLIAANVSCIVDLLKINLFLKSFLLNHLNQLKDSAIELALRQSIFRLTDRIKAGRNSNTLESALT